MLKDREYPIGYLCLTLPSDQLDVNVHPQKSEVRFRNPQQIFAIVQGAVTAAVRAIRRPMQLEPFGYGASFSGAGVSGAVLDPVQQESHVRQIPAAFAVPADRVQNLFDNQHRVAENIAEYIPVTFPQELATVANFRFSSLRYVGQVLECYLICELDEHIVVVDMHAAHERVNYNKIRKARAAQQLLSQKLLIPETVRLTEEAVVTLMEQEQALQELGFDISQIAPETVSVKGVPGVVAHLDCVGLLKECAAEPLVAGWRERLDERIDHITARIACHASVRSGDLLTKQEVYALFAQLDDAELSGACPHGRPVVTQFSREMVERWFGRDR